MTKFREGSSKQRQPPPPSQVLTREGASGDGPGVRDFVFERDCRLIGLCNPSRPAFEILFILFSLLVGLMSDFGCCPVCRPSRVTSGLRRRKEVIIRCLCCDLCTPSLNVSNPIPLSFKSTKQFPKGLSL